MEHAREHRSRRAERQWALRNAQLIRRLAAQLAAVDDLQERVDRSPEGRIIDAATAVADIRSDGRPRSRDSAESVRLVWPRALKECLAEDERFRNDPQTRSSSAADPGWQREQ
ncbi:hypothetical protein [Streptomyces sp. 7N604]|uniref:hypothetical protein n=1 Tax=Streptomyces sp. 7N604 TaxID=3457415 RepID=UPI003FD64A88